MDGSNPETEKLFRRFQQELEFSEPKRDRDKDWERFELARKSVQTGAMTDGSGKTYTNSAMNDRFRYDRAQQPAAPYQD